MLPETMKKVARGGADVAVRINRPLRLAIPDIEAAVRPGLSALFITKAEGVQHLRLLDEAVSELERERGMPVGSIGFGAMIEHPRALAHIDDIAEHGPRVIAMMLGGEDFALETGSIPSDESARTAQAAGRLRRPGARRGDDRHPGHGRRLYRSR